MQKGFKGYSPINPINCCPPPKAETCNNHTGVARRTTRCGSSWSVRPWTTTRCALSASPTDRCCHADFTDVNSHCSLGVN